MWEEEKRTGQGTQRGEEDKSETGMPGRVMSLLVMRAGMRGRVVALEGGHGFQTQVRTRGLVEGKTVEVVTRLPRGPVVVRVGATQVALGRGMAARVLVEVWD